MSAASTRTYVPLPHTMRSVARAASTPCTSIVCTSTARGVRSTSAPSRASSYSRRPSWWTAEYIGGRCRIRPTNPRHVASSRSRVRPVTGVSDSTRPVRSCVSVVMPKRTVVTYSLSCSIRYGISFVASPTSNGRTPVASGSSVPPWPMRRTPSRLRASATASNDVAPADLSTTRMPDEGAVIGARRGPRRRRRGRAG